MRFFPSAHHRRTKEAISVCNSIDKVDKPLRFGWSSTALVIFAAPDFGRTVSVGTPAKLDCEKRAPNGTLSVRAAMFTQHHCAVPGKTDCRASLMQLLDVNPASLASR